MPRSSNFLFTRVSVQKRRINGPICDLTGGVDAAVVIDLTNSPAEQPDSPKPKRRVSNPPASPTVSPKRLESKSPAKKPSEADRPHCPICLDEFMGMKAEGKTVVSTVCGHLFCKEDLTAALQKFRRCPTCSKTLKMSQFHPVYM